PSPSMWEKISTPSLTRSSHDTVLNMGKGSGPENSSHLDLAGVCAKQSGVRAARTREKYLWPPLPPTIRRERMPQRRGREYQLPVRSHAAAGRGRGSEATAGYR